MEARGLEGTDGKARQAIYVVALHKIGPIVRSGKVATTADDNGSLTVWMDDDKRYRCEADRHLRAIDKRTFNSLAEVRGWYRKWMKKIA